MRLDRYSSGRNVRPGFPTAEEIKKTTQAWTGDALAKKEAAETVGNEVTKPEKPRHF
jgi:hypothetical protein